MCTKIYKNKKLDRNNYSKSELRGSTNPRSDLLAPHVPAF